MNMQIWEYKAVTMDPNSRHSMQGHLNECGAEGWELAGILGVTFIFKRPKVMVTQ